MTTEIKAGKYLGRILDYGIGVTKEGNPQAVILFAFSDAMDNRHEMTWYGTLKEGRGREITIDALLVCGLRGNNLETLADGVQGHALDAGREVQLTIEYQKDQNGREHPRVKWINLPRWVRFPGTV